MVKTLVIKVLEYLTHKSTWAGITLALSYVGVTAVGGFDLGVISDAVISIAAGVLVFIVDANKDNTAKVEAFLDSN